MIKRLEVHEAMVKSSWEIKFLMYPNKRPVAASAIANSCSLFVLAAVYGILQAVDKDISFAWFAGTYLILTAIEYWAYAKWKEIAENYKGIVSIK